MVQIMCGEYLHEAFYEKAFSKRGFEVLEKIGFSRSAKR